MKIVWSSSSASNVNATFVENKNFQFSLKFCLDLIKSQDNFMLIELNYLLGKGWYFQLLFLTESINIVFSFKKC